MSETPREAVEFARMVVRAFYPDIFVILMDAVLRMNNYCAHGKLAQRLGIPPKELRQMLNRMVQSRLMKSDKRQQKKVNIQDEKRGTRTVTTEFWYVPLASVVDVFIYRVYQMTQEIDKKRENERKHEKWICTRCKTEYSTLEVLSQQMNNINGIFHCVKIGVRFDRRPHPCGGSIQREDNSAAIKETERVKQMLDEELRALRERAAICANMDIPNHPLEGMDEKTLEEIVPEMVGMHGEKVDQDGVPIDSNGNIDNTTMTTADGKQTSGKNSSNPTNTSKNPLDDDIIPEKPSWFKDSTADDADDDWDYEQENVMDNIKKGTASTINADEEKEAYAERYLREIGGLPPESTNNNNNNNNNNNGPSTKSSSSTTKATNIRANNNNNDDEIVAVNNHQKSNNSNNDNDVIVYVAGKPVKLSQVTEDMHDDMTDDEFLKFREAQQSVNGGANDDDDDEFDE